MFSKDLLKEVAYTSGAYEGRAARAARSIQ